METELYKAMMTMGSGGLVAGIIFFFYRGRTVELAADLTAARARIDQLQDRIVAMLQAQVQDEPQRRETLSKLTRLVEDQTVLLKERLVK